MSEPAPSLDWSHAATDIPSSGRAYTQSATPEECAGIARALGLIAVKRLDAAYKIRPLGKGRFRLEGPLSAEVTQACVVTLKPVDAKLTLALDLDFCPELENPHTTVDDDLEVSQLPEVAPIENGRLNVGEVAFETLSAGLDPFPRSDGAAFEWQDPKDSGAKPNPFAVLAKLQQPDGTKDGDH